MARDHQRKCKDSKKTIEFVTVLTGSQQNPPVTTTGLGAGTLELSSDRRKLRFKFYFKNLTSPVQEPGPGVDYAHFHLAPAGSNGPVVHPLSQDIRLSVNRLSGEAKGVWSSKDEEPLTRELVQALKRGDIYINIHTATYPNGEIRGQVVRLL